MNVQYVSDLHQEFPKNLEWLHNNPIIPSADILILAGDIISLQKEYFKLNFFDFISENFKEVYYIAGNHDFYRSDYDLNIQLKPYKINIRNNVYLINNKSVIIENNKFIFSTLWSNISQINEKIIQNALNDYRYIKFDGHKVFPHETTMLHNIAVDFIKSEINNIDESINKTIVVSHHLPTFALVQERFKGDLINEAFTTELSLLRESKVDYWIYGHSHGNVRNTVLDGTEFLTNQLGYVHSEFNYKNDFKRDLILTL